ncbi:hypothetical protein HDE_12955 [Halotydeus destructor]|nr:hypothetical protein HDE_12955 [Halotydeus destructor]
MSTDALARECSEPRVMDMRCPVPDTRVDVLNFMKSYFTVQACDISSVILPSWVKYMRKSELRALGELLLLLYPSLHRLPDFLAYSKRSLEQYAAGKMCNLKELPTPECVLSYLDQEEDTSFQESFHRIICYLQKLLVRADLTGSSTLSKMFTAGFIERIVSMQMPNLEHLELDLADCTDHLLKLQLKNLLRLKKNLYIVVHYDERSMETPLARRKLEFVAALPHRNISVVYDGRLPLASDTMQFVSRFATRMMLRSSSIRTESTSLTCCRVKELVVGNLRNKEFDGFVDHLRTLRMPLLEHIEFFSSRLLQELPSIVNSTETASLNSVVARQHKFHLLKRVDMQCDPDINPFLSNARTQFTVSKKAFPNQTEIIRQMTCSSKEAHGVSGSDDVELTKTMLKQDSSSQHGKLLMRQVLRTVTPDSPDTTITNLELSISNIGGFAAALIIFLLRARKTPRSRLRIQAVSLEGGIFLNLIPVISGLARNWDCLSLLFWCPSDFSAGAISLVQEALESEKSHHTKMDLIVNCEHCVIHGRCVKGVVKVRVLDGLANSFCFGKQQSHPRLIANLLGEHFDAAITKMMGISTLILRTVAHYPDNVTAMRCVEVADASDHRQTGNENTEALIQRMQEIDALELEVSQFMIGILEDDS